MSKATKILIAIIVTAIRSLTNTLSNLLAGSENHLCAFISQIGPIMADDCYKAQYLTTDQVRLIIEDQCPEFIDYICEAD